MKRSKIRKFIIISTNKLCVKFAKDMQVLYLVPLEPQLYVDLLNKSLKQGLLGNFVI